MEWRLCLIANRTILIARHDGRVLVARYHRRQDYQKLISILSCIFITALGAILSHIQDSFYSGNNDKATKRI